MEISASNDGAILFAGGSRDEVLRASPADQPRPTVAQAKGQNEAAQSNLGSDPATAGDARADTTLRQHPVRPQMIVAPDGAISLEAGATGRWRP